MCGLLALVGTPWQENYQAALAALKSRGPDDTRTWSEGDALLAHHRLAVIDLAGGAQPMASPDGRHLIVFNGEIYNHAELRAELAARGHAFATQSDTEVLLHGYREWGEALLDRLDGMYAFLVWDRAERRAFAARDRLGVKPLFYSTARGLAVASTLQPFFHFEGFPRRLDPEALRDYLAAQFVCAPHTFLRDVRQLPPASLLRYDARSDTLAVARYWEIPQPRPAAGGADAVLERVDAALRSSVRRQRISDVPLGAFLSGGIDSSLIVHYLAEAGSGAGPLETFSVRFPQAEYDETAHARAVAERYGARHHVLDAPGIGANTLSATIRALDQPLADPAYVPAAELSRLTRRHVTVALSGDGGDELFGGYARFREEAAAFPSSPWRRGMRKLIDAGLLPGALLRRSLSGKEMVFYRRVELGPWEMSRKSLKRYLSAEAWRACHAERTLALWRELATGPGGQMDGASLMRADLWTYLSENCLAKTDRASMLHGLEVRVPFLGNAMLDAVLELPASVHFADGEKTLLRRLAQRYLPEAVWNRPKHGFSVPLRDNFSGPWRALCEDAVARTGRLAPFLDAAAVARLWQAARAGRASRRLAYTFIVLLLWLDNHPVEA